MERRAPIEEAAGISLYRRRRHGTNLKLEATAQDLARVDDICQEVARQMRSLKRQAGRARRYRTLRDRLRGLEQSWFRMRLQAAEKGARVANMATEAAGLGEQVAVRPDALPTAERLPHPGLAARIGHVRQECGRHQPDGYRTP